MHVLNSTVLYVFCSIRSQYVLRKVLNNSSSKFYALDEISILILAMFQLNSSVLHSPIFTDMYIHKLPIKKVFCIGRSLGIMANSGSHVKIVKNQSF